MNKKGECGNVWDDAYRGFQDPLGQDPAGEAFEKGWKRHLLDKGDNPVRWGSGLVTNACKQRRIDIHKRQTAEKRGGKVETISLETELPQTDGLCIADTITCANVIWGNEFTTDNPEESIVISEMVEELLQNPLELCRRGVITQKEAAKRLGVRQSTISRRLRA